MARPRVYPDELRERAVRLLMEWREARGLNDGGYTDISAQLAGLSGLADLATAPCSAKIVQN